MISIDISADFKKANRMMRGLATREIDRATSRAINRTLPAAKKAAGPILSKEMGGSLSAASIKSLMALKKAKPYHLVGSIVVEGRKIPLIKFKARQVAAGVSHTAYGKRKVIKGAFVAKGVYSSKRMVFKRTGGSKQYPSRGRYAGKGIKREPIRALYGPSLPKAFLYGSVQKVVAAEITKVWPQRFKQELDFYLGRFK